MNNLYCTHPMKYIIYFIHNALVLAQGKHLYERIMTIVAFFSFKCEIKLNNKKIYKNFCKGAEWKLIYIKFVQFSVSFNFTLLVVSSVI